MKTLTKMMKKTLLTANMLLASLAACAAPLTLPADWSQNVQPFQISDHIYYVGTHGLAAYLLTSGHQAILLDTGLPENAALIEHNIQQLGFKPSDVKMIVTSHTHWDHVGALAQIKQDTGARLVAMQQDVQALEQGKPVGDNTFQEIAFSPVQVDQVVQDGQVIKLGKLKLKATLTPGHTPGCTTWSTQIKTAYPKRQRYNVVFPCSISVAGNVLRNNQQYPGIVQDYRLSFARLKNMQADIVLPSHPEVAKLMTRKAQQDAGQKNAFIDPHLLPQLVKEAETAFDQALANSKP